MKLKFFLLTCLSLFSTLGIAQLGNNNMYLVKNLNTRPGTGSQRYSACWGYVAPNGREYAILGCYGGTQIVDITDSANIREVGWVPTTNAASSSNNWREMKPIGHYLYVGSEVANSGIQIIDLQYLPDSVSYKGKFQTGTLSSSHTITTDGTFLYVNGTNTSFNNQGITIFSVANPIAPVQIGAWTTEYVHDSRVINDTIYASNIYSGYLTIINATNKANPVTVRRFQTTPNPFTHNSARTTDGRYVLTTDETSSPNGKLKIWNVENLNNITFVRNWLPTNISTAIVHNVEIYGRYALIAHYTAGVRLLDIADPTNPVEVAWYDTYPTNNNSNFNGCWGVYMFPSGKIIASDMTTGLYVLKTNFALTNTTTTSSVVPENFTMSQNYPNPFNPTTKINFSLPKSSNVTLKVFDASGKEVASLLNDRRDAGSYTVSLDAAKYGLSSGIYFYTLKTNDFSETKKMTLIK